MKLYYKKNKARQKRISYLRNKRRLVGKEKLKRKRRQISGYKNRIYNFASNVNKQTIKLTLPKQFGFGSNYEETTKSLYEIRHITEHANRRLYLDFSEIEQLGSTASLALAGEIYRWEKQTTSQVVSLPELWNPEVKKALAEMGLFNLLNLPSEGTERIETNRTFVKFIFGNTTDGESARKLRNALEEISDTSIEARSAFGGITEAMNNVIKHAYPETTRNEKIFGAPHPWWLGGSYNKQTDTLCISICDQGVGIPKTLPRQFTIEKIKNLLGRSGITEPDDAAMIKAAIELGRTATQRTYQGKGLQDIKRFIENYENATLKILSLRGEYLYLRENSIEREELISHASLFHGTIIEWRINNLNRRTQI